MNGRSLAFLAGLALLSPAVSPLLQAGPGPDDGPPVDGQPRRHPPGPETNAPNKPHEDPKGNDADSKGGGNGDEPFPDEPTGGPGGNGDDDSCCCCEEPDPYDPVPVPDPVVMTSGKFYYPVTDVAIAGRGRLTGHNLWFKRAYNNREGFSGVLGNGWVTNLDISLASTGSTMTVRDFDGRLIKMAPGSFVLQSVGVPNGAGTGTTGSGSATWVTGWTHGGATLRTISTGYEFTKAQGTRYYFYSNGQIASIKDRNGNSLTYSRTSGGRVSGLTDSSGQSLTFTYDASGFLNTVHDHPLNRTWTYTVSGGHLVQVLEPLGRTESYNYQDPNDPHNITQVVNAMAKTTTYTYDATDRVTRVDYPDLSHVEFTFNDTLGKSTYRDPDGYLWQYTYADPGVVTEVITPMGFKRTYTYDPVVKRMTSSTTTRVSGNAATNRTFTWSYGYWGHLTGAGRTGMANNMGISTSIQFIRGSSSGGGSSAYVGPMVGQTVDAMGISRTVVRDINGNHHKITDRRGNQSEFAYRPDGFPISLKDRLGKISYWEYDTNGNMTKATDRTGRSTRYEYDAGGRCTKIVDALNRALVYTYDAGNRITAIDVATVTQPNPAVSAFTVTAVLRHSTWDYNAADQVTVATDATGRQTHYAYDDVGRTTSVTDHQGHVTSYQYNGRGQMTKLIDPALHETIYAYDADGRNTSLTQPAPVAGGAPVVTSFGFWDNNGIKSLTDANGRTTTFTPNYGTRTRRVDYPDGSYEETVKNGKNLVTSFRNRAGQVRTFTYDPERNMLSRSCPTCSTTFCYDPEDRLYRANDANTGVHGFEYDDEGRLAVSHQPDGSTVAGAATAPVPAAYGLKVAYSYDAVGARQSMTYPDGTLVSYDYTPLGQLHHIYEGAVGAGTAYTYAYDAAGRRDRLTFPNGHYTEWAYTVSGALESVATKQAGGAIVAKDRLLYDPAERLIGDEVDNGLAGGRTFGNDQLDRLVSVMTSAYGSGATGLFGGVPAVTYNYDATGNRTSVVSGSTTTAYTLAANPAWNEYASVGGVACTYDSRHCLLTDGARTLNYDADSRLLTATMGSTSVGYTYDWKNHLTTKEVNGNLQRRYVYDGWHVIAEYDGAGQAVTRYVQGAGVDEILSQTALGGGGSTTHYLYRDHLGSTMALVNAATGAVDQRFRYEAYGTFTVLTAVGTPASGGMAPLTNYLFTGREWQSEIGLYNYRNRFYHPEQGRFCQPDPIGFDGGINVFGYCGAQPASQRDPSGLNPALALECPAIGFEIGLAIGGALVGTAVGVKAIDWLASKITDSDDEYEEPPVRKPSRPSQPAPRNLPKDTRPIDQCPPQRLNGGTPHDIKKWADQGPTDWTGADPNGNIWVDDGNGNGRNLGPFQR